MATSSSPAVSYAPSSPAAAAPSGGKKYQMGGGYTPASRPAVAEPQSSWSAPVETSSNSPSASAAAPSGGKISYQVCNETPHSKPYTLHSKSCTLHLSPFTLKPETKT